MGKRRKKKNKQKAQFGISGMSGSEVIDLTGKGTTLNEKEDASIDTLDELACEIDEAVFAQIMYWVNKAEGEVSGLGKIERINGVLRVTSAILLKQENTSVTTDIEAAAIGKAMFELKDAPGQLNWWWHSHVNMDVFWSGTDLDTIHKIGANGWFLSTVFNKKQEMKTAYYQKGNDFLPGLFVDDIHTSTVFTYDAEREAQWDKEFTDKVTEKKFSSFWNTPTTGRSSAAIDPAYRPRNSWEGASVYEADNSNRPSNSQARFLSDIENEDEDRYFGDDINRDFTDEEIQDLVLREIARSEKKDYKTLKGGVGNMPLKPITKKKKGVPQT